MWARLPIGGLAATLFVLASCDTPHTSVVVQNAYPVSSGQVVFAAQWQALAFTTPIAPGSSASAPSPVLGASTNTAYVVLAPGWDPSSTTPPTSFVVMQSATGYDLHIDETLTIPVGDSTFIGRCAVQSVLTQQQADFITQRVFPNVFAGLSYDAATCTTTPAPDSGP